MITDQAERPAFEVDHFLYVVDAEHRRQVHALIRGMANLDRPQLRVFHRPDGACCQLEEWPVTVSKLVAALEADDAGGWWGEAVQP